MYRCTECQAEYQEYPEYCDCGNDTFDVVYEEQYDEVYEEEAYYEPPKPVRRPKPKRVLSEQELEELAQEKADKQNSLIVAGISLFITLLILVCPPYPQTREDVAKKAAVSNGKLPDVSAYWDDTLPAAFRKGDPDANIPLINESFSAISNTLRTYLQDVGTEFSAQWKSNVVEGAGECRIQFIINRDGIIDRQKMIVKSRNESLDNSVLLLLSKIKNLDLPPEDYKGERIILAFRVHPQNGTSVFYPVYRPVVKK